MMDLTVRKYLSAALYKNYAKTDSVFCLECTVHCYIIQRLDQVLKY